MATSTSTSRAQRAPPRTFASTPCSTPSSVRKRADAVARHRSIDWDGVTGFTAGDPHLDMDDLEGFGPELISVAAITPGSYLLAVFVYHASTLPMIVSASLRFGGASVYAHDSPISAGRSLPSSS